LQGVSWKRLSTGHYIWAQLPDDPRHLLQVLQSSLPPEAAFSDRTAGWLLGLDLQPCQPAVVTVPDGLGSWSRPGVYVRRSALPRSDVLECQGLPTTSLLRTVFDLARHLPLTEAVVAVDMAFHQALVRLQTVRLYVAEHRTSKGYAQARRVVDLAEPRAESQMESRLRMLLVLAGLPRPEVQVDVSDEQGRFWAGWTCVTQPTPSESSTTAKHIARAWWRTTGARIASSRPASACSVSPAETFIVAQRRSSARCAPH
jgi:hypothetical protein